LTSAIIRSRRAEMQLRLSLSFAVLVLSLGFPSSAVEAQPTAAVFEDPRELARKLTSDAIAAEGDRDYAIAIALYQQAYALVAHPVLEFNIGQAYMLSGDLDQAERYYRLYLTHDPEGQFARQVGQFLDSRVSAREHELRLEQRHERARNLKRTGYKLLGTGAGLGAAAFGLYFYREDVGRGVGWAAFLLTATGVGVCWYANGQISATRPRPVTWSPVLGSGFAGIAVTGALP
jgi:tetratricopeptide (TPR) repeat protein